MAQLMTAQEMIDHIKMLEAEAFDKALSADDEEMEKITGDLRGLYLAKQEYETAFFK